MAVSCPQCHAAVVPGMRTCQFCGTPVEYVAPEPAESPQAESPRDETAQDQPAAGPLPAAAMPVAQNSNRPKTAVKKGKPFSGVSPVMALLAGGVILFVIFIAVRFLVIPRIFRGGNQSFTLTISPSRNGGASSGSVNAGELGVDIYPGARALSDAEHRDTADGTVVSATFVSDESMDKVVEFYRTRMTGQTAIYASGSGVVVSISPNPQQSIIVSIAPGQGEGKTRISITNTTAKNAE